MKEARIEQQTVNRVGSEKVLVMRKGPQRVEAEALMGVREATTGRVVAMLPRVWAVAARRAPADEAAEQVPASRPAVEMAFYRKYTEGMLRRYMRLSTEAGRVPSLLGRELFRGNVTSYKVKSFEDVVVFCMDVERCLAKLSGQEKDLIRRIGLQEYTQAEAAALLGWSLRHVVTHYGLALDRLTTLLLDDGLMEYLKGCQ